MANQRTTVTDISEATTGSSFVFLQILSEEQKCTSNSLITDQETPPKYFSLDELQSFVPNVESNAILQHSTTENVINTRQKSCLKAHNKNCSNADLKNCITHVEILQNSKKSDTVVKAVASKSEGRKAPGSNRILPLITSVWEDADLHWKRQKSPKSGRIRKDNRGKNPNKKHLQGGVILDEASEEEEWLERQEKDDHGGSLFRAYSDFFMAEEGGEDREDCICAECGAEFLTAIQVAYHLEYYHNKEGIKLHQCFVCRRKRYPSLVQLNQHLSIAHGIPRPQLTCRTCFMELAGESEAKAHSRKHQALYTCSRCPLSQSQNGPRAPVPRFATCFLLAEHLREIHLPQERPHVCSVCGRHFIHQFVRDLHLQRRHCGYSLTCPEVHQHPSSFLQEILSFNPDVDLLKDSLNGTCLNSFAFLPIASSSERQTIEDSGESTKGTSSFTRNDNQLVSCESNQICLVSKQDKNVFVPENSSVAEKASSLSCSKGGFLFADEVSLLRHVFLAHGKLTNLRLLKWAKEADREDTLFEELWRVYLNISTKHHSIKIVKNKVGLIEPLSQKKGENSALTIPERFSPDNYALSRINKETNQSKNIIETNAIIMKQNELFKLSQVINSSIIKNDDKAISLSNKIPSSIPTNDVTHSSNDLVEGIYLNSSSSSTQLIGKSNIESSLSSVENIFNMSSVDVAAQVNPGLKCQKVKLTTKVPIVGAQLNTEIPNSVISCLMDVLDSVCDVLNERSNLKDFGNMAGDTSLQRNITSVRCLLCRYLASNPLALERHRQRRHFRNKHCPFCSLACQSVDAVWKHVSETHLSSSNKSEADENVSSVGPEEFQQKMHSQKPMQSSSGLRCPVCKKVFPSRGKCNNHQENVHKIEVVSRPLSCKVCSKKFQFQKALERHSLLHCQDKLENASQTPYSCPHCKQTFLRPGFLKRHIASHFEDVSKGGKGKVVTMKGHFGHSCPSCSRRLPTHAKLKAHIRTSHPPSHLRQRFVCSECPVRCNTASGLRVHMRVHTGERPYPCSKCDMSFKRHTALRKHLLAVHSATSESSASEVGGAGSILKCPNCTSTFRDRSNLVRHFLQVHRGLRRFVCGLCGTKYGQNQDLRRHLKVSHDVDAPRIIGSDRRSVDQIYVVPPIMDDLPADHPLAIKIRMIVEEEEQKLDEDSLPHFAETPQQLHLHIHKESVNLESAVSDEGKESEHNNAESYEKGKPSEKDPDKRISDIVSSSSTNKYNELEINNEELVLAGNKERLEQDISNNQLSSEVKNVVGKNVSASKNKLPQRNLILDALISSQISPDMYQFDNNILPIEGGSQLGQEFESNITVSKSIENITVEPAEMNIIMTKQPLDSSLNFSVMPDIFLKNTEAKPSEASASKLEKCAKDKVGNTTSPKVPGNFTCCHCGKEFVDAIRLERHSKVHSDLKPHTCNICGKSFIEKCNLKVHMRSHTGERPYKCEICGKNMRYLKELTDHRRMHLGERPYVCHICSRAFLRLRDLQRHLHIHMSEKKHHCPICNKAFSRLDHLRAVHMRIHEPWRSETSKKCKRPSTTSDPVSKVNGLQIAGEVENQEENLLSKEKESSLYQYFDCQKCKKKFSSRAKLDKHLILHSGQKLHKCSVCGRNFALASYLRAHQNTHRKQQSYIQCPKCPRRFASQETLSVHDEKFHRRIEKLKKFNLTEANEKTGKSKDAMEACDEERFFMSRPGDFDVNLNLEEEMNIQEVELFDPASLSESEKHNTFVYLHVISDDLQIANDSSFIV